MPLMFVVEEGRFCPMVICDHCGRRIADAEDGNAAWLGPEGPDQRGPVLFNHKACCLAFEDARPGGWLMDELPVFLANLCSNVKLDYEGARAQAAFLSRMVP